MIQSAAMHLRNVGVDTGIEINRPRKAPAVERESAVILNLANYGISFSCTRSTRNRATSSCPSSLPLPVNPTEMVSFLIWL